MYFIFYYMRATTTTAMQFQSFKKRLQMANSHTLRAKLMDCNWNWNENVECDRLLPSGAVSMTIDFSSMHEKNDLILTKLMAFSHIEKMNHVFFFYVMKQCKNCEYERARLSSLLPCGHFDLYETSPHFTIKSTTNNIWEHNGNLIVCKWLWNEMKWLNLIKAQGLKWFGVLSRRWKRSRVIQNKMH